MTVTAAQLIFTNVEADRSPIRKRGDQVWLKTPGDLEDAGELKEIATRLSDFKLPLPPSKDPHAHDGWERVQFFATTAGRFVLARSVALRAGDKYNRGGRFHAHALVFDRPDLAMERCDPFVVWDGFAGCWHATPDESLTQGGDWQTGAIPTVNLEPGPGVRSAGPLSPALREEMLPLLWLLTSGGVVAVPAPPARVLDLARSLFAWLPPALRAKASFDTLSTGNDLGRTRYWLAGAGSPDLLRFWRFRTYEKLLPDAGRFDRPPQLSGDPGLYEQWLAARAREGESPPRLNRLHRAWAFASAVEAGRLKGVDLGEVDEELFGEVAAVATWPARLAALVSAEAKRTVPDPLAALVRPAVEGLTGLRALKKELAPPRLAAALARHFAAKGAARSERPELDALGQFLTQNRDALAGNADALKLRLVCRRWLAEWSGLCDELHGAGFGDDEFKWFATWVLTTLPLKRGVALGRIQPNAVWVGPFLKCADPAAGEELHHLLETLAGVHAGFLDGPYLRAESRLDRSRLCWLLEKLAGPVPVIDPETPTTDRGLLRIDEGRDDVRYLQRSLKSFEENPRHQPTDQEIIKLIKVRREVEHDGYVPEVTDQLGLMIRFWCGSPKDWEWLADQFRAGRYHERVYTRFAGWALRALPCQHEVQIGRLGPDQAWIGPVARCIDVEAGHKLQHLVAALLGVDLPAQPSGPVECIPPAVSERRRDWLLWELAGVRSEP